jgi:hypothetical protein
MLHKKMEAAYRFLAGSGCRGIMKIDDEIEIRQPERLVEWRRLCEEQDYMGVVAWPRTPGIWPVKDTRIKWCSTYTIERAFQYFGGGFYWLSQRALHCVVKKGLSIWAEDLAVGYALSEEMSLRRLLLKSWFGTVIAWKVFSDPLPLLTVDLMGGLGNQLFQIATAYAYARKNDCILTLTQKVEGGRPHYYNTYLSNFKSYIGSPSNGSLWNEPAFHYVPIPSEKNRLRGYFQSSKYFNDCSGEIRNLFDPPALVKQLVQTRYAEFLTEEWKATGIVVHVRRGDYFAPEKVPYHGILDGPYYERAIARAREAHGGATELLVFSDDLDWCRAQPAFAGARYVDEKTDYMALYLMSQFRQYVISNSSFSWWAVWLGEPARVVIAPDRWFGPRGPQDWQDIYEPDWIRVAVS